MPSAQSNIRFVIFGQGRTGSKLLVDLLRSHPEIDCDGEVLNGFYWNRFTRHLMLPLVRLDPRWFFAYKAWGSRRRAYGFKFFIDHCANPRQVLTSMHRSGWHILHIHRQDMLAQAISNAVAYRTHAWHRLDGQAQVDISAPLVISPQNFLSRLRAYQAGAAKIKQVLEGLPHLDVVYETDLAQGRDELAARLLPYLGLPLKPLTSSMVKTWNQPYSELIANYDELLEAVRMSEFKYLLDEKASAVCGVEK